MTFLTDIGVNLADSAFDADRTQVISAAQAAGVKRMVVTGSCQRSNRIAAELASDNPDTLWSTAGLHPHHAADWNAQLAHQIESLAGEAGVRAVGECGLDYFRDIAPRAKQRAAFESQLDIAKRTKMPVFLHQRDAIDDFAAIIRDWRDDVERGVAHCFTDDQAALRRLLDLDLHIGITGWICDERRGQHLLDIVKYVPADRLMIETDAPYLLPRSLRPRPRTRRNEPKWLPEVAKTVAAAREVSVEELTSTTTATANQFFAAN